MTVVCLELQLNGNRKENDLNFRDEILREATARAY